MSEQQSIRDGIDLDALIEELSKGDGNGCRRSNDLMLHAVDALENAKTTLGVDHAYQRSLEADLDRGGRCIDRIDAALQSDARSAMRVVAAQEIINDYRDKADD